MGTSTFHCMKSQKLEMQMPTVSFGKAGAVNVCGCKKPQCAGHCNDVLDDTTMLQCYDVLDDAMMCYNATMCWTML